MDQHHCLATESRSSRFAHTEGKSRSDSSVYGVARGLENLNGCFGGEVVLGAGNAAA
jgi:hypothetical protein